MTDPLRERAFEELLRSPLDDEPRRKEHRWRTVVFGFIAGILVITGIGSLSSPGDDVATVVESGSIPPAAAPPETVVGDAAYPPGFRQVTDGAALRVLGAQQVGESRYLGVATAVERGSATPAVRFNGGRWELETADGTRIEAEAVIYEPLIPTVFSLQFPVGADTDVDRLHLVERWELDLREVSVDLGAAAVPFELQAPVTVDLGDGVTFRVDALELAADRGTMTWSVDGVDRLAGDGVPFLVVFVDPGGTVLDNAFGARAGFGPGGVFLDPDVAFVTGRPARGTETLHRAATDVPPEATIRVQGLIPLVRTVPADLTLSLEELPSAGT